MTALRIMLTIFGSVISAGFVVLVSAMAATVLAVATNSRAGVPGLVTVTPGEGTDLADTEFISPGSALWLVGLTIAITCATLGISRWRSRGRHDAGLIN